MMLTSDLWTFLRALNTRDRKVMRHAVYKVKSSNRKFSKAFYHPGLIKESVCRKWWTIDARSDSRRRRRRERRNARSYLSRNRSWGSKESNKITIKLLPWRRQKRDWQLWKMKEPRNKNYRWQLKPKRKKRKSMWLLKELPISEQVRSSHLTSLW